MIGGIDSLAELAARLRAGDWPAGTALPAERVLAAQLHCSRAALREQLRAWREAGLIASRRGSGHWVAAPADTTLAALVQRTARGRAELLQVRGALESMVAADAAELASRGERARIRRAGRAIERALASGDWASLSHRDGVFHATIVDAAHNRVLAELCAQLRAAMQAGIELAISRLAHEPPFCAAILEQHAAISAAISDRDRDAAAAAAAAHTRYVADALGG